MAVAPIKVMIVDDSAVVRSTLSELLQAEADIQVIGSVPDPLFALSKMQSDWPDVVITDLEMPRMDGLSFVRQVMRERPTPMVLCASLTSSASNSAFQALDAGAFSLIGKPASQVSRLLHDQAGQIRTIVRAASQVNPHRLRELRSLDHLMQQRQSAAYTTGNGRTRARFNQPRVGLASDKIITLSLAAGGLQALDYVLAHLPADVDGIVVSQHMPAQVTAPFIARLNNVSQLMVKPAEDGELIKRGYVLMVSTDQPMEVSNCADGFRLVARPEQGRAADENSIDLLLNSVARVAGDRALGIVMTGVGGEGARGLKTMADAGAVTAAQDEASCVFYGMPREAVALGAVQHIVSLYDIPEFICRHAS